MKYLDVASLSFDSTKCVACNRCIEVCPHQVFVRNEVIEMMHKDLCMECGACQMNCPASAISVETGTGCAQAIFYSFMKRFKR